MSNDSEFIPDKPLGSRKRKNRSIPRGRRLKTSFYSTSSSSPSSSSPAPTPSSSITVSLFPHSLPKSQSSGQKSTSGRVSKRACVIKKSAVSKQKQFHPTAAHPRRKRFDSKLPDFNLEYSQAIWDADGRAPCPIAGCIYRLHENRVSDDKRHYLSHSNDQIWVCSVEFNQVLARHPHYRLPGHSNGGCTSTFTRKDAVVRHIRDGVCAH